MMMDRLDLRDAIAREVCRSHVNGGVVAVCPIGEAAANAAMRVLERTILALDWDHVAAPSRTIHDALLDITRGLDG